MRMAASVGAWHGWNSAWPESADFIASRRADETRLEHFPRIDEAVCRTRVNLPRLSGYKNANGGVGLQK